MRIPGEKRSPFPDECGNRAGMFAEAVRDGHMDIAWSMLSKETRGMRMGVWATRYRIDMQVAYRAGYNAGHPMRSAMLEDFRTTVLRLWPWRTSPTWVFPPPAISMTITLSPSSPSASPRTTPRSAAGEP